MPSDRRPGSSEAAILFADISGSTQLYAQLGDAAAQGIIGRSLTALSEVAADHRGTVIKTIGDEVMCRFDSVDDAFDAAIEMQRCMKGNPSQAAVRVGIRVGLHFGEVLPLGGDVFGDAVNVAARVAAIAKRDQIVTTEHTVGLLAGNRKGLAQTFDRVALKGRAGEVGLWLVRWEESGDATQLRGTGMMPRAISQQFRLSYGERTQVLFAEGTALTLGRATECNVAVKSTYASRLHARVLVRRGKFVLVDESTNGTYVYAGRPGSGGQELFIKREELPLPPDGAISLGQSTAASDAHLILFTTTDV